jgi:hypothetical protein
MAKCLADITTVCEFTINQKTKLILRYTAQVHVESWSGKGLVHNNGDPLQKSSDPFPIYFNRTIGVNPSPLWDFSLFQPDAVVINLGTNDYDSEPSPTQAQFEHAYREFLRQIRQAYGEDMIFFLACGPMISNPCCEYVQNVVSREYRTHFINMQNLLTEEDTGVRLSISKQLISP